MRIAIEANDVVISDEELSAVDRAVSARVGSSSSLFVGARDLRLRLVRTKNALLCVAAVGFAGGGLVTSTAESVNPLAAMVGALDDLPARFERFDGARRVATEGSVPSAAEHAAVRAHVRRLLG